MWAGGIVGAVTAEGGAEVGALIGMRRPSLRTLSARLTATLTDGPRIVKRSARRACEQGPASEAVPLLPLISA